MITNDEYKNAFCEVLEIIKYIPKEDYKKIPEHIIRFLILNSNNDYHVKYNPNLTLDENFISKRAKAIIAILFRDYWATDTQREIIINKQRKDKLRIEEEKKKRYNTENIFRNNSVSEINKKEITDKKNMQIFIYKDSFFRSLIKRIKNILK